MFKKLISAVVVTAIIASLFSFTGVLASEKVIFTDSFEKGMDNWTYLSKASTDANASLTSNKASDGKYSVCVTDSDENNIFGFTSIDIPAVAGATYTISGDVYKVDGIGAVPYLNFLNAEGKKIGSKGATPGKENGVWAPASVSVVAPEGTAIIRILLTGGKATVGTSYVDNIKLTEGGNVDAKPASPVASKPATEETPKTEAPATAVTTGGDIFADDFENGMDKWEPLSAASTDAIAFITTKQAAGGKYSVCVIDNDTANIFGFRTQLIPATAGATYTISGDVYKEKGTGAIPYLNFFNAEGKKIGGKGAPTGKEEGEWANATISAEAPEGTTSLRVLLTGSSSGTGTSYIDNIKVTCALPEVKEESKMDKINKSSIALFLGSANALVNGSKTLIDKTNDKVIADTVEGRTLVPVRFIAENYGAEVGWDDATQTVTLKMADKTATIVLDKKEITVGDKVIAIDVPAQTIEGRTMLPLRAFVEQVMGKTIFWDDRGLIVITDAPILDAAADKAVIDEIIAKVK